MYVLFAQPLEQTITLGEHFVIFCQRLQITAVDLAQRNIQIAAALAGATINQFNIFWQKEHGAQQAHQIHAALGYTIYFDLFGVIEPVPARGQQDFQIQLTVSHLHTTANATVRNRLILCLPAHSFALIEGMHWFAGRQKIDSFQQVRFALGVLALQHRQWSGKIQIQVAIVAKVGKGKVG